MSKTFLGLITPRHTCNSKSPSNITPRIKKIVIELCDILRTQSPNWEETLETRLSEEEIVPSDVAHQLFDKIRDIESGLKFFNWISQRPYGCPLDGIAYSSLLKLLAKSKAFFEIDLVFVRLKSEKKLPTHDALNDVILAYSGCGLIDKALAFYSFVVETYGCVPNVFACNSLLTLLVKSDRLETAYQVYSEMLHINESVGTGGCADNYSTCILVNALCKKGKVDEARKLIVDRWGQGCIPNVVFYNTLIDGYCKKGDIRRAFLLFKELKLKGFLPTVETYGAMINGLCKEGNFGLVDRLMNEMKSRCLVINVRVYNSIIDARCRHGHKMKAVEIFKKMIEIGCAPDIITYNILIYDCCRRDKVKEAEQLVEQAARRGLRPNKFTYTPLLNIYCRHNDIDNALELLVKMINDGEKPDLLTYNSLIHGIVVLGEVETALLILEKMTERGIFPDAGVYNVLMSGLCKKGKLPVAKKLLFKMLDQNVQPDKFVYTTLIDGFIRNGNLEEAKKLFEHAIQEGMMNLDVVGYNAMIKGYCKDGKLNDAVSCVKSMIKAHIFPDEFTYSTIIDGYVKQHDMDGALRFFSHMVKHNCKPNVVTYTTLINGFCQTGDNLGAEKLLKEMKFRGVMPNVVTYSILIGSYCKNGKLAKAASFFEQMLMSKCNPNDVTFHNLVHGFSKYERINEFNEAESSMFLDINKRMISDGWSPTVAVYSTIVVFLCLHGMLNLSLQLSVKMSLTSGCPIVFAALLYGICLEGNAKEWSNIISCNLNESELIVAVDYLLVFDRYLPQGAVSEALLILQKLVDVCKSKHHEVVHVLKDEYKLPTV